MSEELKLIEETADRLFTDESTIDTLKASEAGTFAKALWSALDEAGLTKALLPEEAGGVGLGFPAAGVLMRAAGYHGAPVPLAEQLLAHHLLHAAKLAAPEGLIALAEAGSIKAGSGKGSVTLAAVPHARDAAHILIGVPRADKLALSLVAARDVKIAKGVNMAGEPRDNVTLDAAHLAAEGETALPAHALRLYGALMRAGAMAGALSHALDIAVRYVNERVQFGKPIGKFQAVQQQLAVLSEEVAAAGAAAGSAFEAAEGSNALPAIAGAKIRAGLAVARGAPIAHQVHGAIGFTTEYPLNFATRRLWSWRNEYGAEREWALQLGRMAAKGGPNGLWPFIVGA